MKYSFIIPVCDDQRITNSVDSFLNIKEVEGSECLIVCNGSDTRFINALKGLYSSNRKIRIVSINDKNISRARNIGVILAKNDFVVFVDSDCTIPVNYLKILRKFHIGQEVVRGAVKYKKGKTLFDENNAWIRTYFNKNFKDTLFTPNLVVKRSVFNQIGYYNESLSGSEDTDWSHRFEKSNKFNYKHLPQLIINHGLDNPDSINKTWIKYGMGLSYRLRKDYMMEERSLFSIGLVLLKEIKLLRPLTPKRNLFVLDYLRWKTKGWFLGWVKWSKYSVIEFQREESFYKSSKYFQEILKPLKVYK